MKLRRWLTCVLLACIQAGLQGQNLSEMSDGQFFEHVKHLSDRGNDCYQLSDKEGIRLAVEALRKALEQRKAAGRLTPEQEDLYMQPVRKLEGDYHYEHSDVDPQSFARAEQCYKQYQDYYKAHGGTYEAGRGLYVAHQELAQLCYKQGRYEEAVTHLRQAVGMADTYMTYSDEPWDRQSQLAIALARTGQVDEALRLADEALQCYEDTLTERYGELLRKKAKILMLREEQGGQPAGSGALRCYRDYFTLKRADALQRFSHMDSRQREQYWMRVRPFVTDCYRLEDADPAFLYDVTLFSKALLLQMDSAGGGRQDLSATWQMIQQRLKPGACAVEFVQYEKHGRQQMGALVLRHDGRPQFVRLTPPDSVLQYQVNGRRVEECIYHVYGAGYNDRRVRNSLYTDTAGLFRLVWTPALIQAVGDAATLWFAPDGYMHRLAIEYMLPQEMGQVSPHRLTSTRRLLDQQPGSYRSRRSIDRPSPGAPALMVGGVDYEATTQPAAGNDVAAYRHATNGRAPLNISELPASLTEVEAIRQIRGNTSDLLLTGAAAQEQQFAQRCQAFPIIHISSHGHYSAASIPQGTDLKPCLADSTLSQCFVALSGSNAHLHDNTFDPTLKDGLLSAKELSALNLSQVQLVVMSCCETALGKISPDGVYGIQRGLKNAGAQAMVCSLWDIYDQSAALFMVVFHYHLAQGVPLSQAFQRARDAMADYSDGDTLDSAGPVARQMSSQAGEDYGEANYKNAFILIDALE